VSNNDTPVAEKEAPSENCSVMAQISEPSLILDRRSAESSCVELCMLPKAVPCLPPRAGKSHKRQRAAFAHDRLRKWLAGERGPLWKDLPPYPKPKQLKIQSLQSRQSRCTDRRREGALAEGCQALVSEPPLQQGAREAHLLKTAPFVELWASQRRLASKHRPGHGCPCRVQLSQSLRRRPSGLTPCLLEASCFVGCPFSRRLGTLSDGCRGFCTRLRP
jgi:hypothetical protein